jgi:hypothetical protein
MKYKIHKLLQITTIAIIVFAAYVSFKQVEGFQGTPAPPAAPITNSATVQALLNVINSDPKPAWFTTERVNALKKLGDLSILKGNDTNYQLGSLKAINDAFTASKAAGEKDDITFDKIIKVGIDYANNYVPNSATPDALLKSTGTIPPPAWYTPERDAATKKLGELTTLKIGKLSPDSDLKREIILKLQDISIKAFTASKAAGDKDDVTFDKIMKAGTEYLNSIKTPSESSNLPLYIGAGVGGVVVLGTIGYFMFSTPAS